ncbi:MAG: hypothetical protein ABSE48_15975 [Verrucomicrobiota bacterium]|jgi:hypothetical protein
MKQPDWRAAAHLLSIADAKRFSESGMRSAVEVTVNQVSCQGIQPERLQELMNHVRSSLAKPIIEVEPAKQLPEPKI